MAMVCQQCLPRSVVQPKGKHCQKSHCHNKVVDTFRLCWLILTTQEPCEYQIEFSRHICNVYPMCASITTPLLLQLYDGWPSQYRHGSRNNTAEAI